MQQSPSFSQIDETKAAAFSSEQPGAAVDAFSVDAVPTIADWAPFLPPEPHSETGEEQRPAPSAERPQPSGGAAPALLPHLAQAIAGPGKSADRFIVIPAEKKRKKALSAANAPTRHLSPRLRQMIVILTILVVFGGTLATLLPLSAGQNSLTLFSGLGILITYSQGNLQIQAQQTQVAATQAHHPAPMLLSHSQYVAVAEQDATNAGIPPTYFVRQIQQESGFNPNAVSPSGAVGIAQFLPSTAAGLGIDPWDPIQALQGAARMMANLYHQYGDYAKALAAYNAGSANLNRAISSCGANWLSCMPAQTQNYVAVIMG